MAIQKDLLKLAVYKSLSQAPLTIDEALEIGNADTIELMECGCSHAKVELVRSWFKHEAQRMLGQAQLTRSPISESARKSGLIGKRLKTIIAEEVIKFEKKKRKQRRRK